MENAPELKRRFQFSLGTLLMGVIALGACMGFVFSQVENTKLRAEILKLRDDLGMLDITNPEQAWFRTVKSVESDGSRFRLYVPRKGNYRLGWKAESEDPAHFDKTNAQFGNVALERGEFTIDVRINPQSGTQYALKWNVKQEYHSSGYTTTFDIQKKGYDAGWSSIDDKLYPIPSKSSLFDPSKPQFLIARRFHKASTSATPFNAPEDGPGIIIWFEEAPK